MVVTRVRSDAAAAPPPPPLPHDARGGGAGALRLAPPQGAPGPEAKRAQRAVGLTPPPPPPPLVLIGHAASLTPY